MQLPWLKTVLTKRKFLSKISTLFDPLEFLTPFVVRANILMQEVWISGIDWDDQLPENISDKATKWFAELQNLANIRIGRCLRKPTTQVVTDQSFFSPQLELQGAILGLHLCQVIML